MSRNPYQSKFNVFRALFLGWLLVTISHAQGPLTNGSYHDGAISVTGETDQWTFTCGAGVTLWIRVAEQSGTNFDPELRLFKPGAGTPTASNFGTTSTAIDHTTTVAGTYTIEIRDSLSTSPGTGNYRIFIAAPSLPYTILAGDQGGSLTNGMFIDGRIDLADIDIFTVQVNALEELRVQIARTTTGCTPLVAIYGPNGALLNSGFGATDKATVETTVAGTYTVIVFDTRDDDGSGSGNYRLYMSRPVAPYDIPPGDQGGAISSGAYYDGTINPADMDTYQFDAVAGELLTLQLADMSANSYVPMLRLYAPDGTRILSVGDGSTCINHLQTTVAGNYTLIVQDGNADVSGSGNYRLYFSQSSKPSLVPSGDEGGELTNGGSHDGTIGLSDIDTYHIDLDAGDHILLKVADTSNSAFDPVFALCGPEGKSVDTTTWGKIKSYQASSAGTYTLYLRDGNFAARQTGTYRLYCAKTPGPFIIPAGDQGGTLSSGVTYPCTSDLSDIDIYRFQAAAGATYHLQVTETTATSFQPKIEIHDSNGTLIGDAFSGTTAQLTFPAILSGEYTVFVHDSSIPGSVANYEITLNETPGSVPAAAGNFMGTLANGDTKTGTVNGGAMDRWQFAAQAGQQIWVQISVGQNPMCDSAIYAPDGSVAAYAMNRSGSAYHFKALQSGAYTVMITPNSGSVSTSYQINHAQVPLSYTVPVGDEGGMMANGQNYAGSLILGDMDIWEFNAATSDRVWFQIQKVSGIGYSPEFSIYSPSGRLVSKSTDLILAKDTFIAPETGIYKVLMGNYLNSFSAGYQVVCAKVPVAFVVPSGDEGGELENGKSYTGEITTGDVDPWTFQAQAGEKLLLQQNDDLSINFIPDIRVYSPSGKLMASAIHTDLASFSMTASESGTYTVLLGGNNGSTGQYHIYLAKVASPYAVPIGEAGGGLQAGDTPGGVLPPGGIDIWSFHAVSGDNIALNLTDTSGNLGFSIIMLVYGPDGSCVSGRTKSISFIASLPGTYTVVILEEKSQVTGTYSLNGMGMTAKPVEVGIFRNAAGGLVIAWPSPSSGWILQQSDTMQPGSWTLCPSVPTDNGFEKSVTIEPNVGGRCFFRLADP